MRTRRFASSLLLLCSASVSATALRAQATERFDLLIAGGSVLDGIELHPSRQFVLITPV
jgi:hypothetical protein